MLTLKKMMSRSRERRRRSRSRSREREGNRRRGSPPSSHRGGRTGDRGHRDDQGRHPDSLFTTFFEAVLSL